MNTCCVCDDTEDLKQYPDGVCLCVDGLSCVERRRAQLKAERASAVRARLDEDGTAKPLTEIVGRFDVGRRIGFVAQAKDLEYRSTTSATDTRTEEQRTKDENAPACNECGYAYLGHTATCPRRPSDAPVETAECPLCLGTGKIDVDTATPNPPSDDGGWNDATRANRERSFPKASDVTPCVHCIDLKGELQKLRVQLGNERDVAAQVRAERSTDYDQVLRVAVAARKYVESGPRLSATDRTASAATEMLRAIADWYAAQKRGDGT